MPHPTPKKQNKNTQSPAQEWEKFIAQENQKSPAQRKLPQIFTNAQFSSLKNNILTLNFQESSDLATAKPLLPQLRRLLPANLSCREIQLSTGTSKPPNFFTHSTRTHNPLAALCHDEPNLHHPSTSPRPVLEAACTAEMHCEALYQQLTTRTRNLTQPNGITLSANFKTDVRVGGTRGFCELLLPVLHPVFGIPYLPAASLKGAARAVARTQNAQQIQNLLGYLSEDGKTANAAKVEFLDAFPLKPCLDLDIATPQWNWQGNLVKYKPTPHPLLVLNQPQFLIGLVPTPRGTHQDVLTVRDWLQTALHEGIGAHISAGYGRTELTSSQYHTATYPFELWTQGIYGATPSDKSNNDQGIPELRAKAIRGSLRYWFRAIALSFYPPEVVQTKLEPLFFGTLTPTSQQGSLRISLNDTQLVKLGDQTHPHVYEGAIVLEAKEQSHLILAQRILELASLLGGIGRGSRRPLHFLTPRMRGCHWQLKINQFPLAYNTQTWQTFMQSIRTAFQAVRSPLGTYTSSSGSPSSRCQDVLDHNACILLIKSPDLQVLSTINNWRNAPCGAALTLLYSNSDFKGKGRNPGNPNVGGELGTPSYVLIQSVYPAFGNPYQVVTLFDVRGNSKGQSDRQEFVRALKEIGAIQVFPTDNPSPINRTAPSRPQPPRR